MSDDIDFKRPEGLYLKFSEPMMEPHTPVVIERVNGDCTVTKIVIARDEARKLISQLSSLLEDKPSGASRSEVTECSCDPEYAHHCGFCGGTGWIKRILREPADSGGKD